MDRRENAGPGWVVGVDIGGTWIKAVLVDPEGVSRVESQRSTPALDGADRGIEAVTGVVAELLAQIPPGLSASAVGVAVPGAVDVRHGIVQDATNLGWKELPLAQLLNDRLGLPVFIEHDVRSAALAEVVLGEGRQVRDFLFVTLGTGVGGAVVIDSRIHGGAHQLAGEIGHMVVSPDGPECSCGKRGCLEAVASASAIVRRVREAGFPDAMTGEQVAELVQAGDPHASAVWGAAARALGQALANYVVVMDPQRIVLGGGLAEAGDLLLEPVRAALASLLDPAYPVKLDRSSLGSAAGRLGAAVLARQKLADLQAVGREM